MGRKSVQPELFQYVFDASSLINIERSRKMALLRSLKGAVLIPQKVAEEVSQPNTPLQRFITAYPGVIAQFQTAREERDYLRFCSQRVIDEGEASAMAIAMNRNKELVIDERETKATGKAREHGIKVLSSQDFIKQRL